MDSDRPADVPQEVSLRSSVVPSQLDSALLELRSVRLDNAPNTIRGVATLRQFLWAVFTDWASGITGGASAPLAITAQFLDIIVLKVLFNLFAIGCFVFAAFWTWRKEHKKVEAFENNLPNLEVYSYKVDVRGAVPESTFLHLTLINNPKPLAGGDAEARNVRAQITFFDQDGKRFFTVDGRWADTIQPSDANRPLTKQPTSDFQVVDFTIGQKQELAIAFKRAGDKVCYPFNDENYQYLDFRNPRRELRGHSFTALVEVRGQRVHKRWKLTFSSVAWVLKADSCEAI